MNGSRLWVEDEGEGPPVLFIHGGLGDSRLFEPQARALAGRFRCIRYDLRHWGRSESPDDAYSEVADAVGVLDVLGVERAAVVGLSYGGGIALDVALEHPGRVWALVHVAGAVSGLPADPYSPEQSAAQEAADGAGDLELVMAIDFDVWAPLGADDLMRELWRATPDARGVPDGAVPAHRDAHDRLHEIAAPTLVIAATHDPPAFRAGGSRVVRDVPGVRLVEVDSDHYLTLRHPQQVTEILLDFLTAEAAG